MSERSSPGVYQVGGCRLDLERGTLERDGAVVPLRAKSWLLLAHLARNAGRVVSKDELLDRVWPDVTVTEDSLTQAVRDLRRALGDERQQTLRTVARRGYLLAAEAATPHATPPGRAADAAPRVAVLAFASQTSAPEDQPLLDGLAEEIAHGLARFRGVTVIAPHSSLQIRPEARLSPAEIGARLGAGYLLEGTARRSGDRLAISVALIEAAGGRQLWGERLDWASEDIRALQDTIARRVIARLVANLEDSVLARAAPASASLTAFEHLTRGIALLRSYGPDVNERGREQCLRALAIEPDYGLAHAYLALADTMIGGYGVAPRALLEDARDRAITATTLAPEDARCHRILAVIQLFLRDFAASERQYRHALELNPYDADTMSQIGYLLATRGRPDEGLDSIDRAIALNPLHPPWYHVDRAKALYSLERFAEAADALGRLPRRGAWHETFLAAALAMSGAPEAAAPHLARAAALVPGWDPTHEGRAADFERPEDAARLQAGIRRALAAAGQSPAPDEA